LHALLFALFFTFPVVPPPDYTYLNAFRELAVDVRAAKGVARTPYLSQQLEALFKNAEFTVLPSSSTRFVVSIEVSTVPGTSPESVAAHVSASLLRTYPDVLPAPHLASVLLWSSSHLFACPRTELNSRLVEATVRAGSDYLRAIRPSPKAPTHIVAPSRSPRSGT